jgi:putative mycofactocin binding protein MftB
VRRLLSKRTHPVDLLGQVLSLHPQVALRPEPFGALAYHFDNRRLVFLKHPDVVRVITTLGPPLTVAEVLTHCEIDQQRWPAFTSAISSLLGSEMLYEH